MKEEEKTICWLGTIPECDKDKVRYPTKEEMDKMMNSLESMPLEEVRSLLPHNKKWKEGKKEIDKKISELNLYRGEGNIKIFIS